MISITSAFPPLRGLNSFFITCFEFLDVLPDGRCDRAATQTLNEHCLLTLFSGSYCLLYVSQHDFIKYGCKFISGLTEKRYDL